VPGLEDLPCRKRGAADHPPDVPGDRLLIADPVLDGGDGTVGALTGLTHGRVCEDAALRALVTGLVDEGKAVADAQGIVLDADPEDLIDHAAKPEVAYDHKASMLQDVEARRQTEIDYLNGGIVRFGRELGVPTPLNQAIATLVKGVERSWRA
jgi:2-dehydropantoate 2-reductase